MNLIIPSDTKFHTLFRYVNQTGEKREKLVLYPWITLFYSYGVIGENVLLPLKGGRGKKSVYLPNSPSVEYDSTTLKW